MAVIIQLTKHQVGKKIPKFALLERKQTQDERGLTMYKALNNDEEKPVCEMRFFLGFTEVDDQVDAGINSVLREFGFERCGFGEYRAWELPDEYDLIEVMLAIEETGLMDWIGKWTCIDHGEFIDVLEEYDKYYDDSQAPDYDYPEDF